MTRETKNGIHLFVHRAFQVTDCVRVKYSVTVRKFSVSISVLVRVSLSRGRRNAFAVALVIEDLLADYSSIESIPTGNWL